MIKAQISRIIASNIIGYISISFSILRENPYEDVCLIMLIMIIILNISQETTVFGGRHKLTSAMKLRPEVIVDFKFDALYSKSSYRASSSRASKKVNWKFVLVGGCANPT